jgi:hypothetical protein
LDADDPQGGLSGPCPHCGTEASLRPIDDLAMHVTDGDDQRSRVADLIPFETPRKRRLRALVVLLVCVAGIGATLVAKNFGRSLPKVVRAGQEKTPAPRQSGRARSDLVRPAQPAVTLQTLAQLENLALLAEQNRRLAVALGHYDHLLDLAGQSPALRDQAESLIQRVRRQRDLLIVWQTRIQAGMDPAEKPDSLDAIFQR